MLGKCLFSLLTVVCVVQVYVLVMYIQLTGNKVWSHDLGQPIFSSPAVSSEAVVVACVDKRVYGFSHAGSKVLVLHFY
jgi:outer membrane protein assembly factor BamB